MHEVSIALGIIEEIGERLPDSAVKITAVHLRIGALTAVDVDALTFAWDLAADGSPAAGSRLVIEHVPLSIDCAACNTEREVAGLLPVCPACGASSSRIVRGRELLITALEIEDAVEDPGRCAEHPAQKRDARERPAGAVRD